MVHSMTLKNTQPTLPYKIYFVNLFPSPNLQTEYFGLEINPGRLANMFHYRVCHCMAAGLDSPGPDRDCH